MLDFVELWVYLTSGPLFGLTATVVVYVLAHKLYTHLGQAPWANPVLWSVVCLAGSLLALNVKYPVYFAGAQFIHVLLGPAVVALAWPLWQRKDALVRQYRGLLLAAVLGGGAAVVSAYLLGKALGLPHALVLSLVPKSVTAPVAMGVAQQIGGIPALAAVFAVLTGMVGAISGKYIFNWVGIGRDAPGWIQRGFAYGTASHGIGAARAMQVNADAGAYAGLALAIQVLLASLLIPLVFKVLAWWG
jgi:predicted murein hydrolase (TIGR00659 family)